MNLLIKYFIEQNIDLIDQNNFSDLYHDWTHDFPGYQSNLTHELTEALLTCDIDPLQHMSYIPDNYLDSNKEIEMFNIPDHIQHIGYKAFAQCTALEKIHLPDNLKTISTNAFRYCINLHSVVFPDNADVILDPYAFDHCERLEHLKLPRAVKSKSIPIGCFMSCYKLSTVRIPLGIETIDQSAFAFCTSLKTVDIPLTVKYINMNSFVDCPLQRIRYAGTQAEWNEIDKDPMWKSRDRKVPVYCSDGILWE